MDVPTASGEAFKELTLQTGEATAPILPFSSLHGIAHMFRYLRYADHNSFVALADSIAASPLRHHPKHRRQLPRLHPSSLSTSSSYFSYPILGLGRSTTKWRSILPEFCWRIYNRQCDHTSIKRPGCDNPESPVLLQILAPQSRIW